MDVRYHAGGYEAQTVVPGQSTLLMNSKQSMHSTPAGHGSIRSERSRRILAPACGNVHSSCYLHYQLGFTGDRTLLGRCLITTIRRSGEQSVTLLTQIVIICALPKFQLVFRAIGK